MQLITYIIYLILSCAITLYVGKHLHNHGYFLILELFENEKFTKAVNNFLLLGYYLINLGYVVLSLYKIRGGVSILKSLELLSTKIGFILLLLGYMHVINILILNVLSTKKEEIIKMFNH